MYDYDKYVKIVFPETVYVLITVIFLFLLNGLNKILTSEQYANSSAFNLLGHNDYQPLKYFFYALILGAIGVLSTVYFVNNILNNHIEFSEALILIASIFINVILIILLIIFIDNPILRTVAGCMFSIVAIGYIYLH